MKSKISFDELVEKETRALARTLIEDRLAKLDPPLPLPKDSALEIHIDHLIAVDPSIREQAKVRVEARTDAFSESLRAIGLESEIIRAVDIEL